MPVGCVDPTGGKIDLARAWAAASPITPGLTVSWSVHAMKSQ